MISACCATLLDFKQASIVKRGVKNGKSLVNSFQKKLVTRPPFFIAGHTTEERKYKNCGVGFGYSLGRSS